MAEFNVLSQAVERIFPEDDLGAGNFAHNGGDNPTGTVGATAYRAPEGIVNYSKTGRSLM